MKMLSGFALLLALTNTFANQGQLVGKATDQKSGELLYTEVHTFVHADSGQKMKTSYLSNDSLEIASRVVNFEENKVAGYVLILNEIDYQESIKRSDTGLEFMVTENTDKVVEEVLFDSPDGVVIDAGFNNFLLRNWDSLLAGETLKFDFASTAQLGAVKLQVSLDKKRSTKERAMFSMTAANMLFRMLLTPIKVGFYRDSRQLAYYRGISNLKDKNGDAYKVEINFADGQHSTPELAKN